MTPRLLLPLVLACICASLATAQSPWPGDHDRYQLANLQLDSAPTCRAVVPLLTSDSLGPLRPGQSLRELERACPRLLFGWDWGNEGIPAPAVVLRFGRAVVEVEFSDTAPTSGAYRISTDSRL